MSIKIMTNVWDYSETKGSALLLMLAIADHANDYGEAFPGIVRLAKKTRLSERQVSRLIQQLEALDNPELEVDRTDGKVNKYRILLTPDKLSGVTNTNVTTTPDKVVTPPPTPMSPEPSINQIQLTNGVDNTPYNKMVAMVERIMGDDIVVHTQKDRDYIKEFIRVGVTAQDVVGAMTWRASERMPKAGSVAQLGRGILTAQRLRLKDEAGKKKYLEFDKDKYIKGKFKDYVSR